MSPESHFEYTFSVHVVTSDMSLRQAASRYLKELVGIGVLQEA